MPKAKLDLDKKPTIEILVLNMKTVTSLFFFSNYIKTSNITTSGRYFIEITTFKSQT